MTLKKEQRNAFPIMWSKNKLKFVRSLAQKKYRDAEHAFVAEGPKAVGELAVRFRCRLLVATEAYLAGHADFKADEICAVSERELEQASSLTTAHEVLAVFEKPIAEAREAIPTDALSIVLDGVQDPGNLGTIIRLADWFGIERIVCSRDVADAFSPKVVQATMGALARVSVVYTDLTTALEQLPDGFPVFGTFLEGENIYTASLTTPAALIMGNEGKGISEAVGKLVSRKIHIPSFPAGRPTVESLNVAVATSICCSEFCRPR